MKKVAEILGLRKTAGDFGIEIEVEGAKLPGALVKGAGLWKIVDDGSLRGRFPDQRAEYVLINPVQHKSVKQALEALSSDLAKSELDFSFRTSCHVHVNVQELTDVQLQNFVYAYLLLEEILVNYCGEERVNNRFCLRFRDAEGLYETLYDLFSNGVKSLARVNGDQVRYAALNLHAVRKYGSLEFRSMRGTLEVDVLTTWIDALNALRNYAMKVENPTKIFDEFNKLSRKAFVTRVLGNVADKFFYRGMEDALNLSFSITLDFPFLHKYYQERVKKEEKNIIKWNDLEAFVPVAPVNPRIRRAAQVIVDDIE